MKRKLYGFIIISLILTVFLAGCAEEASVPEEVKETPVKIEDITFGTLSGSNNLSGTIIANDEAEVTPNMVGEIQKINVEKGDKVSKGDIIAELDNFDERNALEQQRAALKQAKASLKSAQNGRTTATNNLRNSEASLKQAEASLEEARKSKDDNVDNIEFEIKNAELALKQTEQSYNRVKQLYEAGLASEAEYDDAKNGLDQAKMAVDQVKLQKDQVSSDVGLKSLEASVEQAKVGVDTARDSIKDTEASVEQAQAGVEQAQLSVEAAQERLDDKLIKAPIAGEITDVGFKVGEMANQQEPFAVIVSLDKVKVSVNVLPEMLAAFQIGDEISVTVGSDPEEYTAVISYVAAVSSGSGLFTVEADLDSNDRKIRPGMVASVELDEVLVADSILVPTDAIIQQEGLDVVFVVEDGIALRKEIEVIRYGTENTAVGGDLIEGEQVVTSGQNLLEDGDLVKIMEEE